MLRIDVEDHADAAVEGPLQAVLEAVAQGDFDDGGLDDDLRALDVQALEGGFDALVLGRGGVDEQGVVDAVGHDAHGLAEHGGDDVGALLVDALPEAAEAAAGARAEAAGVAETGATEP